MRASEALKHIPLFAGLIHDHEECPAFVEEGEVLTFAPGERVVNEGDAADFYVVLEGNIQVLKKVEQEEMLLTTHTPGIFFGESPLLLGTTFFAGGRAEGEVKVFRLGEDAFWKMLALCPSVTRQIMQTMAFRVQNLESISQGLEKLVSLGTMAAGLAHELNNPAAAARRAAKDLHEVVVALPSLACQLHKQQLAPEKLDYLANLGRDLSQRGPMTPLDALTQSDREEAIIDWLDSHEVDNGWKLAEPLVGAGLDVQWLEKLAAHVPENSLGVVLNWLTGTLSTGSLVGEIEQSTARMSDLVKAVKSYSYMDQTPLQDLDIHEGLESTLTMLGHKLRDVKVVREYDCTLPIICAYGGELNQVWTNLLDNAIDAVAEKSKPQIRVRTRREGETILVEITDNGTGIAPAARDRLFEPFFTTKGVGKGTGLGLIISYRIIVSRHHGDIHVESQPGETCFQVRIPIEQPKQDII